MTTSILPVSPAAFARAKWEDVAVYFDELASRSLDEGNIEAWLLAWSTLEELVTEAAAQAMIAYTIDTSDPAKEADHLRFSTEIMPKLEERSVELARHLVASGYNTPTLATTLRRFRTAIEIFREENVPVFSELEELGARYSGLRAHDRGMGGRGAPATATAAVSQGPRPVGAERAYRAATQPYMEGPVRSPGSSTGCTPCVSRPRTMPALPIIATTFSPQFSVSITPRPIASDSTRPSRPATPAVARMLEHRRRLLTWKRSGPGIWP